MSEFRFSRGILALAVTLAVPAVARAAGADNAANSGKARHTKQETEVTAKQTNLTKPEAPPPPKKETGPVLTVDQFVAVKQEGIMKLVDWLHRRIGQSGGTQYQVCHISRLVFERSEIFPT